MAVDYYVIGWLLNNKASRWLLINKDSGWPLIIRLVGGRY